MSLCDEGVERVLESEVIFEEVMCWNVSLSSSESFEYLPFVKGTSDKYERVIELERVMTKVSENEQSPVVNVVK